MSHTSDRRPSPICEHSEPSKQKMSANSSNTRTSTEDIPQHIDFTPNSGFPGGITDLNEVLAQLNLHHSGKIPTDLRKCISMEADNMTCKLFPTVTNGWRREISNDVSESR